MQTSAQLRPAVASQSSDRRLLSVLGPGSGCSELRLAFILPSSLAMFPGPFGSQTSHRGQDTKAARRRATSCCKATSPGKSPSSNRLASRAGRAKGPSYWSVHFSQRSWLEHGPAGEDAAAAVRSTKCVLASLSVLSVALFWKRSTGRAILAASILPFLDSFLLQARRHRRSLYHHVHANDKTYPSWDAGPPNVSTGGLGDCKRRDGHRRRLLRPPIFVRFGLLFVNLPSAEHQ